MMVAAWMSAYVAAAALQSSEPRTIAAAPLVTNPVHVAAGHGGTLWVIERSGDTDALVLLRDENSDGAADSAVRMLDGLLDVRGVASIGERRVLVLEPPQLLDVEDRDGDGKAERVTPIARGLGAATGLAVSAEDGGARTILVAGDDRRFVLDGTSVRVVGETPWRGARAVAIGLDGEPIAAFGSRVVRGDDQTTLGLAGAQDLGVTRDAVVAVSMDRTAILRPGVPDARWSFGQPQPAETLWKVADGQGPITGIDRVSAVAFVVALGATETTPGSVFVWQPPAGTTAAPATQSAPVGVDPAREAIDRALRSNDESARRAIVERALRTPDDLLLVERLAAAIRLNDRRPGRLALDRAPDGFDPAALAALDPTLARVLRRLSWPGRHDAAMDPEPPPSIADVVDRGRRLYSNCLTCHGPTGKGQPGVYPPLARSEFALGDPERLAKIVLHGLQGAVTVDGRTFAGLMPPPPMRTDEDIAAVLTYVRQAFGNDAEPVSAELVARVRSENAQRRTPWTVKELLGQ
ncbi:MAG: c-type cytochrome [Phycisphaerae bacterium]|nr:c-type cytochrome [Phycisphaerae bacterium]